METKIIVIGNQKGGVGKSTLTELLANDLAYERGKSVCVIDADHKQGSIYRQRNNVDIPFLLSEGATQEQISNLYPIHLVDSERIIEFYEGIEGKYEYVFIDLPGNILQKGVITAYCMANLIISPTSISFNDLDSTQIYMSLLNEHVIPARLQLQLNPAPHKILLYKVNPALKEFKEFSKNIEEISQTYGFDLFASVVTERQGMLPRYLKSYPCAEHKILTNEYQHLFDEIAKTLETL